MDDFIPSELIKRAIQRWWLLLLIMIAGGGAGMIAARLQNPIYESQASITTSIDFAYTDRLSEDDEDYLIATVGDEIESSSVFEQVKQKAAEKEITVTDEMIKERFSKARQGYRWELTVRADDPVTAQTLTQIWVDAAGQKLAVMQDHSLDLFKYHTAELALQNCFSQMVVVDPASGNCSIEKLSEIRSALETSPSNQIEGSNSDAILLSRISTEITDNAYLPSNPIIYKGNLMTFAGCLCGLIIGLGILIFGKPKTNERKKA